MKTTFLIKGAGNLPSVKWIRKKIVPKIKAEEEKSWKELVDQNIEVKCDETTDRRGEAIFLTLFKILPKNSASPPKLMVASVTELSAVNNLTTSQAILQVRLNISNYYTTGIIN